MNGKLLYEQLIRYVQNAIEAKELSPGDKAPSIAELRRKFRVSPITAIRALQELTHAGYLEKLPGRGYFVRKRDPESDNRNICVGCLLRGNYVSDVDHYFNDLISGIQLAASLARVDLLWTYLATPLVQVSATAGWELLDAAMEINDRVSGFLVDERTPDELLQAIAEKTGKPVVLVNRTTSLPYFSVAPDYYGGMQCLFELLLRMQYNKFIMTGSGLNHFSSICNKAFYQLVKKNNIPDNSWAVMEKTMVQPMEDTYRDFHVAKEKLGPGKLVLISASDCLARTFCDTLAADGYSVPGDVGIAATVGLAVTNIWKPEISTLKVDTVKLGIESMNLLLVAITGNEVPVQRHVELMPSLIFGETL